MGWVQSADEVQGLLGGIVAAGRPTFSILIDGSRFDAFPLCGVGWDAAFTVEGEPPAELGSALRGVVNADTRLDLIVIARFVEVLGRDRDRLPEPTCSGEESVERDDNLGFGSELVSRTADEQGGEGLRADIHPQSVAEETARVGQSGAGA